MSIWKRFVDMLCPKAMEQLEFLRLGDPFMPPEDLFTTDNMIKAVSSHQPVAASATYITPTGALGVLEVRNSQNDGEAAAGWMRDMLEQAGATDITITIREMKR